MMCGRIPQRDWLAFAQVFVTPATLRSPELLGRAIRVRSEFLDAFKGASDVGAGSNADRDVPLLLYDPETSPEAPFRTLDSFTP